MGLKIGDYYRVFGESRHVAPIEAVLDETWQDTNEIARRSRKSRNYTHQVLHYLFEEARADRQKETLERPLFSQQWKWVWRRPTRRRYQPLPGEPRLDPVEEDEVRL